MNSRTNISVSHKRISEDSGLLGCPAVVMGE